MQARGHAISSLRGWQSLVATSVLSCAVALSQLVASEASVPERGLPTAVAAPPEVEAWPMHPDGKDGWYAIAEVAGSCELPLEKRPPGVSDIVLIEHHDLRILGTSHLVAIEAVGPMHWRIGDRFIAHIAPLHNATAHPSRTAPMAGPCNATAVHDMSVLGLVPVEHDELGGLAHILAEGWPATDTSPYVWPVRSDVRERSARGDRPAR
jgi:hypothetical protein